ncbi:MAG: magnesium chelatase, partial [Ferruginibacter sp.]
KRVQPLISATKLKYFRDIIFNVKVESKLIAFIAGMIHETRNNSFLYLGASTRASIALLKASKASAVLNDRDFVIPEDIIAMAPHVLRHRVILSPEKEMEGISANELIDNIIKGMEIPR